MPAEKMRCFLVKTFQKNGLYKLISQSLLNRSFQNISPEHKRMKITTGYKITLGTHLSYPLAVILNSFIFLLFPFVTKIDMRFCKPLQTHLMFMYNFVTSMINCWARFCMSDGRNNFSELPPTHWRRGVDAICILASQAVGSTTWRRRRLHPETIFCLNFPFDGWINKRK